jgi:predicted alpha/beta-fold hydrolase
MWCDDVGVTRLAHQNIKIPYFAVGAADDPLCSPDSVPPPSNDNQIFALSK